MSDELDDTNDDPTTDVPIDTTAPAVIETLDPDPEPGARLNDARLDSIALMTLQGMGPAQISRMSGVSERLISSLHEGRNARFQTLLDAYRQKMYDGLVRDQMNLLELLPDCYSVWKRTLTGDDMRLANECAWKVHDRLIPPTVASPGAVDVNLHIGHNVHVENQFSELIAGLGPRMSAVLQGLGQGYNPNRYLRSDTEALPAAAVIPVTQPSVTEPSSE